MYRSFLVLVLFCSFGASSAHADSQREISYSGRITALNGAPETGAKSLAFAFYRSTDVLDPLAVVEYDAVSLIDGIFSVRFDLSAGPLESVFNGESVYLEVIDRTSGRTYPRQRFESVPYALRAMEVPVDGTTIGWNAAGELTLLADLPTFDPGVTSLNGQTGNVSLTAADLGALGASEKGTSNGVATLDGGQKVLQDPASAQVTAAAGRIPVGDASGRLDASWLPPVSDATSGASLGMGAAVYSGEAADELRFRTLLAGPGIIIEQGANEISISSVATSYTDAEAKAAAVADSLVDGIVDQAPSQNAVVDALAAKQDLLNGSTALAVSDLMAATVTTSGRIGIGTSAPAASLELNTASGIIVNRFSTGPTAGSYLSLARSKTSVLGDSVPLVENDIVGKILFEGATGSGFQPVVSIAAYAGTGGHSSPTDMPTYLRFSTTADGTSTTVERLRITEGGDVGIGTSAPGAKLDVKGSLRLSTAGSGSVNLVPQAAGAATTYALPANYPAADGYVLSSTTSGAMTWVNRGLGLETVTQISASAAPGTYAQQAASCPAGKAVVSGGCTATPNPADTPIMASYPAASAWVCRVKNNSASSIVVTAYAVCVTSN